MTSSSGMDAAVRTGERLLRRVRSAIDPQTTRSPDRGRPGGWLAVTVLCDPQDLDADHPPGPLAELGAAVEVRVDPAPADRGTELRARLRRRSGPDGPTSRLGGADDQAELRGALRRAKQLVEVGEVLRVDPAPHGERTSTPAGALLEAWTRRAPEGGVL
ncbi:MAG TPA: hypothetical protein VGE43_16460 [Acidimicrobiales bacterium]